MINRYEFEYNDNSWDGKVLRVNGHKVHSGVYTMLFYKVSEHPNYLKSYTTTNKFEHHTGFHNNIVAHIFERKETNNVL